MIRLTEYSFEAGLKSPLRLAVVSDLHSENCDGVLKLLEDLSPSAVLCPGDVIHRADPNEKGFDFLRRSSLSSGGVLHRCQWETGKGRRHRFFHR